MSRIGYIICATAAIVVATMLNYASLSSSSDGSRTHFGGYYYGGGSYSGGSGYSGGHK